LPEIVPGEYIVFLDGFVSTLGGSTPAVRGVFPLGSTNYQDVLPGTDPGLSMKRHQTTFIRD